MRVRRKEWLLDGFGSGEEKPTLEKLCETGLPVIAKAALWAHEKYRPAMPLEDLRQELWLRVISKYELFDPGKSALHTWIINVANNQTKKIISEFRALKRRPHVIDRQLDRWHCVDCWHGYGNELDAQWGCRVCEECGGRVTEGRSRRTVVSDARLVYMNSQGMMIRGNDSLEERDSALSLKTVDEPPDLEAEAKVQRHLLSIAIDRLGREEKTIITLMTDHHMDERAIVELVFKTKRWKQTDKAKAAIRSQVRRLHNAGVKRLRVILQEMLEVRQAGSVFQMEIMKAKTLPLNLRKKLTSAGHKTFDDLLRSERPIVDIPGVGQAQVEKIDAVLNDNS